MSQFVGILNFYSPIPEVLRHNHTVQILQVGVNVQLDVVHGGVEGQVLGDVGPECQQTFGGWLCESGTPELCNACNLDIIRK